MSWDPPTAIGRGTGWYVGPNQIVGQGAFQPVTIVAFELGLCGGQLMYGAVEWHFQQPGDKFDPTQYEEICNRTWYPGHRPDR
jgi:hypothetical protein